MAPLQVLLLAGLLQAFLHFNHAVFRAVGQPQRSWQLGLASLALNGCLVMVAVRWGVLAVAWAYLLRVALIGPWGAVLACRELGLGGRDVWRAGGAVRWWWPVVAAGPGGGAVASLGRCLAARGPVRPRLSAGWSGCRRSLLYGGWLWLRSPALDALQASARCRR